MTCSEQTGSVRNQYIASVIINLINFCHGCAIGWISPSFPILLGQDSPLDEPLTIVEASSIASIICIGGLIATPFYGWASDKFGKKKATLFAAIPYCVCWILKISWKTANGLLVARFLAGVGGAGAFLLSPAYSVEIASIDVRGTLGSFLVFFFNGGIVFAYTMGTLLGYDSILLLMLSLPVLFFILMYTMPESPLFLVKQNRIQEAAQSIAWLRREPVNSPIVENAILLLKKDVALAETSLKLDFMDDPSEKIVDLKVLSPWKLLFKSSSTFKAFSVCMGTMLVQLFTGNFAIISFANDIFRQAGSNQSPNNNAIIVGVLQLIGSITASSLIEKVGRRVLYLSSCCVVTICIMIQGTYFYLKNQDVNLSNVNWIPVTALSIAVFTYSIGLGPIPYILPSEILIVQVRRLATNILYSCAWIFAFLIAQFYLYFVNMLGIHNVFWGFSFVGVLGVIMTIFCLPETKGKSLESIIDYYKGKNERGNPLLDQHKK